MAGRIRSMIGKVGRFLQGRSKIPKMQTVITAGHRGIAAGDLTARHQAIEKGEQPYSAEEIADWEILPATEARAFVLEGKTLFVHSSNVRAAKYYLDSQQLHVEFKGSNGKSGSTYMYGNVSMQEAIGFTQAQSKGGWVWSTLRVRGSKTAHKKPFQKSSMNFYLSGHRTNRGY